jgi:hypothetical protein
MVDYFQCSKNGNHDYNAFCYIIYLNINTEELSRYVAKIVPVNEITDSKLSIFKIGKS